jgi:hypothetical protein
MKSYKVLGFVVVAMFLLSGAAQADSMILNGDFATYTKDGNTTTSIADWTFPAGWAGVTSTDGAPDSPSAYVGPDNAFLSQTTSHVIAVGERYTVSYLTALSYDEGSGAATKVTLAYDDAGTLTEIPGASQSLALTTFQDWQSHTFTFTPQSGQAYVGKTLGIKLIDSGITGWVGFDTIAVDVSSVPEPNAILLLATGFVGLLAYAWRTKK